MFHNFSSEWNPNIPESEKHLFYFAVLEKILLIFTLNIP